MTEREAMEAFAERILGDNPTWRESGDFELVRQCWQASRQQMAEEAIGAVLMTPSQFGEQDRFAAAIRSLTSPIGDKA